MKYILYALGAGLILLMSYSAFNFYRETRATNEARQQLKTELAQELTHITPNVPDATAQSSTEFRRGIVSATSYYILPKGTNDLAVKEQLAAQILARGYKFTKVPPLEGIDTKTGIASWGWVIPAIDPATGRTLYVSYTKGLRELDIKLQTN